MVIKTHKKLATFILLYLTFFFCILCCSVQETTSPRYSQKQNSEQKLISQFPKSYYIEICHPCEEGCVSCDNIIFTVYDSKNRDKPLFKTLGETHHSKDVYGTPSTFWGYLFSYKIFNII